MDCNFYDSYQDACYFLYERVHVGGIIIFDDFLSHRDVMKFWTEFNEEQKLGIGKLIKIDKHSAWFRKPEDVVVDWRYFKAPMKMLTMVQRHARNTYRRKNKLKMP